MKHTTIAKENYTPVSGFPLIPEENHTWSIPGTAPNDLNEKETIELVKLLNGLSRGEEGHWRGGKVGDAMYAARIILILHQWDWSFFASHRRKQVTVNGTNLMFHG